MTIKHSSRLQPPAEPGAIYAACAVIRVTRAINPPAADKIYYQYAKIIVGPLLRDQVSNSPPIVKPSEQQSPGQQIAGAGKAGGAGKWIRNGSPAARSG